jgi:pimeloyl-ACP methyl ester carboxylesterase
MGLNVKHDGNFSYVDEGQGQPIVLLHGLFGALSNWESVVNTFSKEYRVVIPMLPLYSLSLIKTTVTDLSKHVHEFLKHLNIIDPVIVGNSLGGHVALVYAIKFSSNYKAMTLTGSSGLFENGMGGSYPKRGSYEYIKEKTEYTFYDPNTANKELVDEVFDIVNDRNKIIRVLALSKSAMRHNLAEDLHLINKPVQLIWGQQDRITPPEVAEEFHRLLGNSELHFIDRCGHAPMMECPDEFNKLFLNFLKKLD